MSGYTVGPSRRLHKARKNLVNRLLFPTVVLLLVACTASRAKSESTTTPAPSLLPEVVYRPRGEFFWGCPVERHASPTHGLFFNYPNGDVLLVTIATSGCLFASNGQRMAFTDAGIRNQVEHAFTSA